MNNLEFNVPNIFDLILNDFEKKRSSCVLCISKGVGIFGLLKRFLEWFGGYNSLTLIINLEKDDS